MPRHLLPLRSIAHRAGVGRTSANKYKADLLERGFGVGEGRAARFYLTAVEEMQRLRDEGLMQRGKKLGKGLEED